MNNNDYGLKLKAQGFSRKNEFHFPGIPLLEFFQIDRKTFTFMVSQKVDDEMVVLSFDFSKKILNQISTKIKSEKKIFTRPPFYSNKFVLNEIIYINIKAKLGKEEQDSSGDAFIPLIIEEIS